MDRVIACCVCASLMGLIAGVGWGSQAYCASSRAKVKHEDIDAYSRRPPATPARAKDRWVKIWHNGLSWEIAWYSSKASRSNRYDIKGLIKCKGEGGLADVRVTGKWPARKLEHNKDTLVFEADLGVASRAMRIEADAEYMWFSLLVDGLRDPKQILIGEKGESPKQMPFTLKKPEIPENDAGRRLRRPRRRRAK